MLVLNVALCLSGQDNISRSPNDSSFPDIAINSEGKILVVWEEADWPIPDINDIFYVFADNGVWSEGKETFSQIYNTSRLDLSVSGSSLFLLAYADGKDFSSRDIFHRKYDLSQNYWSNIERVYLHPKDSSNPRIERGSDGTIYTLWEQVIGDASQIKIVMNLKDEEHGWLDGWENVSQNLNSRAVFACFKEFQGTLYACWMENRSGRWDIFYNERTNGGWGVPVGMGGQEEKFRPSLCLDRNGTVHVIYSTRSGNVYHVTRSNKSWSLPNLISSAPSPEGFMDLQLFPNNTLHAVWPQVTPSGVSIFYACGTPGGVWKQPLRVAEGIEAENPHIAHDIKGQAHVVWEDRGTNGKPDIYYTKVIPEGIIPRAVLVASASEGIYPFTVEFDATLSSAGQGDIESYWWDFGDGSGMKTGQQVAHTYEKAGLYPARLFVTNSLMNIGFSSQDIKILAGPFPPVNVSVKKIEDKALFHREKINHITWAENLKNRDFVRVKNYVIYRKLKSQESVSFKTIGLVEASVFGFADRNILSPDERDLYAYAVSAVDNLGREGPKKEALALSSSSPTQLFKKKRVLK